MSADLKHITDWDRLVSTSVWLDAHGWPNTIDVPGQRLGVGPAGSEDWAEIGDWVQHDGDGAFRVYAGSGSAAQLVLPGVDTGELTAAGVTLTSTGAIGLDGIDAAGARRLLAGVETASSATNWLIGDLVLEQMIRAQSGDTSLDTVPMPADQAQARRCLLVAVEFPHERRRSALSWSHHDTVRAFDDATADRWLDDAETHGWSVATLREHIRADAEQASPPLPGTRPWAEEHRSTIVAVAKVLAAGTAVLVHPDGRWEEAETSAPSNVVDVTGGVA